MIYVSRSERDASSQRTSTPSCRHISLPALAVVSGYEVNFCMMVCVLANYRIQFEFLKQLSSVPGNTIVGLVRDKATTDQRIETELGIPDNVHILEADMADYQALEVNHGKSPRLSLSLRYRANCGYKATVGQVTKITGGKLDFIIANAALVSTWSAYDGIGDL